MPSWFRYAVAVYFGLLLAGTLGHPTRSGPHGAGVDAVGGLAAKPAVSKTSRKPDAETEGRLAAPDDR